MKTLNKSLSVILLPLFLLTFFLGLFHAPMNMDMTEGESSGCMFMLHEETFCPMSLTDHLEAWKDTFLSITPQLLLLLVGVAMLAIASIPPNLMKQRLFFYIPPPSHTLRERVYTFTYRALQELFSNGTVHPRLYNTFR